MGTEETVSAFRLSGGLEGVLVNVVVGPGMYRIGALEENEIQVPHVAVSRRHAVLEVQEGRLWIRDLGSKNGTWINGERVDEGELLPGDVLGLGPVRLTVTPAPPEDAELAIQVPECSRRAVRSPEDTETGTEDLGSEEVRAAAMAEVVAELAEAGTPTFGPALSALARWCEADGAVLLEIEGGEEIIRSAVGANGTSEAAREVAGTVRSAVGARGGTTSGWTATRRHRAAWAACSRGSRRAVAVAVIDPCRRPPIVEPLLRMTARLMAGLLERAERAGDDCGRERSLPELVFPEGHVLGTSTAMRGVYEQLRQLVDGEIPILLLGETGVGKELLARTIHLSSPRRSGPFVAVNCAAIPSELLEAELFGIEKGVATGVSGREGKLQQASGGVLFLDEIGEMPLELQPKLLRVLQAMEVHPVGARRAIPVDVRLVTATNCDIGRRVREGKFRRDLYYRIAGYTLEIPPLRERRRDIPALVEHFLNRYAAEVGKPIRGLTAGALEALVEAPWPGNVRQLEHEVRRLVYRCPPHHAIDTSLLSPDVLFPTAEIDLDSLRIESDLNIERHTAELERRLITLALARTRGNRSRAAKLLGISRNGLALKMQRLGIQ